MAQRMKSHIGLQFIGMDSATGDNISINDRLQRSAFLVRYNRRPHVAAALHHAHDNRLGRPEAAKHGFVDLDMLSRPAKRAVTVYRAHIFADLMAHAPSRFVSDAKPALDFLGSNAVPRGAEKEHHKEPVAQGGAGAIKGSASGWIDLMPAIFADIGAAGGHAIVMGTLTAACAIVTVTKAVAHDVIKAAFFGWESCLKLAKGWDFRVHAHYVAQSTKCRKGIIVTLYAALED